MSRIDDFVASLNPAEREQFKQHIGAAKRRESELDGVRNRIGKQLQKLRETELHLLRYATALREGASRAELAQWRDSDSALPWMALLNDVRTN